MKKKKILILYAPLGAGHGTAAKAIEEAFLKNYPDFGIENVSVLDFTFDILRRSLPKAFVYINSTAPFLYSWIYKYYNNKSRINSLNSISDAILKGSSFVSFIKNSNPDFIISTNPLPMQLVSKTKEKNIINILSGNVCTDYGFHSFWHNADVNYYFVANEEIKESLIKHNADKDSILITGIPVRQKFKKLLNREEILEKLGFNRLSPTVLAVGGKIKCRNLLRILNGVKNKIQNAQFIIITGRDEKLAIELERLNIKKDPNIRIFGFVDNLEEYMEASDLILTKAGGLTVSECFVKNLPMVINDIIPVQEEDNLKYVVKHNAAVDARTVRNSIDAIINLLSNRMVLEEMKKNCSNLARPNAADDIADFVASKINS